MDKYNINFPLKVREFDRIRLINQIWKLVPMRENQEEWETQLAIVIEEISGLARIYQNNPNMLILLSKLEGLTSEVCSDFMLYRKTVFKCMNLLSRVIDDE